MINVVILGFENTYAGSMLSLVDIFSHANQLLTEQDEVSPTETIKTRLVSMDGKSIPCQNGIMLDVQCSVEDIQEADVIIVTSIHDIETILKMNRFMVDWLRNRYKQGTTLASICTGAFLLAETGLLDEKQATTHWSAAESFKARYPRIRFDRQQSITGDETLYCAESASSNAGLVHRLLENRVGLTVATRAATYFNPDSRWSSQHNPLLRGPASRYDDKEIQRTQEWIHNHLRESLTIETLSRIACMSPRTLERRFKCATGVSPLTYIHRVKVGAAKYLLETTRLSFDEISYQMGYENSGAFRKVFVKWAQCLPSHYRKHAAHRR